ncbi:hypothetical protein COMA1_10949 [Candidatus Nitrospira nitrosa]|uniref:Uncharacterized protein n=1 Tax=Candidatus Nitrospira nitrosa TaxID=1742972 RepID=A0A0S4L8G8_9BACT|nr:hypothetical protein COMA1_10949 [Candidatus Nitrospira nitrosa]
MLDDLSEQPVRYSPDVRDLRQGFISELVLGFVNTLLGSIAQNQGMPSPHRDRQRS